MPSVTPKPITVPVSQALLRRAVRCLNAEARHLQAALPLNRSGDLTWHEHEASKRRKNYIATAAALTLAAKGAP